MVPAPTSILTCKTQSQECRVGGDGLARKARDKDREDSPGQSSLGAQICLSEPPDQARAVGSMRWPQHDTPASRAGRRPVPRPPGRGQTTRSVRAQPSSERVGPSRGLQSRGSSLPSDHHHPHCSPSHSVLRARVAAGAWPPEPRQGEAGAVGTVAVLPSPSPPNFPLGSQETEVKVAAGALGAGWPHSRWGERHDTYRRGAGSGLPAFVAGGLLVRAGRGFAGTGSGRQGRAGSSPLSGVLPCRALGCPGPSSDIRCPARKGRLPGWDTQGGSGPGCWGAACGREGPPMEGKGDDPRALYPPMMAARARKRPILSERADAP